MNDQLGIRILGCGYWGINYIRLFSELSESRVMVVCDQLPDRLGEVGQRFPGVKLTTDIDEVLQMDGVNAVVICTPATTHFDLGMRCVSAGKHVLVEKPITRTAVEAEELVSIADSMGLTLMVGHTFLFNPAVRKVKEYIEDAQTGRVYYLYARRTNLGPIRRDVNALWDLAPHDVAIFNYFLDSTPDWVSAVGAKVLRNCREDVGFISLGYPGNIVGHIHVSWADPSKCREVVVVSSNKRIVFNDLNGPEQVRVFEKGIALVEAEPANYGEYVFQMRDGDILSPKVEVSEPLKNQCRHFLQCLKEGVSPITSGQAGIDIVKVLEAVDRSIERKGAPVEVEKNGHHAFHRKAMASAVR